MMDDDFGLQIAFVLRDANASYLLQITRQILSTKLLKSLYLTLFSSIDENCTY